MSCDFYLNFRIKGNKLWIHDTIWMNLENIILEKLEKPDIKTKQFMILRIQNVQNR